MWNISDYLWFLSSFLTIVIFGLVIYITRVKNKADVVLTRLAYVDTLTGLHNMNYFYHKAPELLEKNPNISYAVVCCDIKNFKYINQTYGYTIGDRVLCNTADILSSHFNDRELCARIGNDQFIVLYAVEDYPQLLQYYAVLEEIIHRQNFDTINVSLSFATGVYQITDKNEELMKIIDKANLALKYAKKNPLIESTFYDDTLLNTLIYEKEVQNKMHNSFANQEFKVYVQPKYDLKLRKFTGAEALLRWSSVEKGLICPDEFIPIFEKNGFIVELDFFVLEEVCKKIRGWLDHGIPPINISVNQSKIHLDNPMYLYRLQELIERYKIPKNTIELELTESMFLGDSSNTLATMRKIREIGFSMSIDDFGSGYSSLNLLKEIPVDILKLDKAFLEETADSERSRTIITHVVMMSRALGMCVVCEGVETEAQVTFLQEINCDLAQGYFYAKPMPLEDLDAFLQANNG